MSSESTNHATRCARGFSIAEAIAVLIITTLLVVILLPHIARTGPRHGGTIKDASQVRTVVQAMHIVAGQNGGAFPLPSQLDAADATIGAGESPLRKDNTGNLLSFLIFQGSLAPQLCVSPAESNRSQVGVDGAYEFDSPSAATAAGGRPADALWDPGFAGTPVDPEPYRRRGAGGARTAHQSYAQAVFSARRGPSWAQTFGPTEALFGNRGPGYRQQASPANGRYELNAAGSDVPGTDSNTLLIHGSRTRWEGNIGYNDGHVAFERRPDPDGVTYIRTSTAGGTTARDNLFVDEADDAGAIVSGEHRRINNFLRPVASLPVGAGTLTEGRSGTPNLWVD